MNIPSILLAGLVAILAAWPLQGQDSLPVGVDTAYVAGEYRVFTGAGEPSSVGDVVAAMGAHEVVFIGETHDDPTGHALELELFQGASEAYGSDRPVALSLEFFERDVQSVLEEYLSGLITEGAFRAASRPWPRYETDYRPLVEYAKDRGLGVVAANAPRRYVSRATRLGRESLTALGPEAQRWLAPLPYGKASEPYLDQWVQVMSDVMEQERMKCGVPIQDTASEAGGAHQQPAGNHANMSAQFDGQVLWDATMAYWVNDYLVRHPGALVLHMVGSFHVSRGTGIPEHLVRYRPGSSSLIVMLRAVDDVASFEPAPEGQWGDFVIQTDRSRTLEVLECRGQGS